MILTSDLRSQEKLAKPISRPNLPSILSNGDSLFEIRKDLNLIFVLQFGYVTTPTNRCYKILSALYGPPLWQSSSNHRGYLRSFQILHLVSNPGGL